VSWSELSRSEIIQGILISRLPKNRSGSLTLQAVGKYQAGREEENFMSIYDSSNLRVQAASAMGQQEFKM
jgi:hypothetical protein